MTMAATLRRVLERAGVPYEVLPHPRTATSLETAEAAHIPGDRLAKSVVLEDEEGRYVLAVIPATHRLRLGRVSRALQRRLGLATEPELAGLFRDCEPGAVPPVGEAYGLPTVVDDSLLEQPEVYIEAGDHEDVVHLSREAFQALMQHARHGEISRHL